MIKYLLFLLMSVQTLSCENKQSSVVNPLPAQIFFDVAYGSGQAQKMDVYLPAGRTMADTKFIVMIHGGGWSSGDKSDFNAYVDTIKRRMPDYAIFNVNYRLSTGSSNTFPTQENDVRSAMDFIAARVNEYNISSKMVLMGASAGGHLALLQGYKYDHPLKPKAIIDLFGPTDLTELYVHPSPSVPPLLLAFVIGGSPSGNPDLYYQSSPINFVNAQSPPTIIFQGGADPLVSPLQSELLNSKLESSGVPHQYIVYPTEGHGWYGSKITDSFDKIQAFLSANVK